MRKLPNLYAACAIRSRSTWFAGNPHCRKGANPLKTNPHRHTHRNSFSGNAKDLYPVCSQVSAPHFSRTLLEKFHDFVSKIKMDVAALSPLRRLVILAGTAKKIRCLRYGRRPLLDSRIHMPFRP